MSGALNPPSSPYASGARHVDHSRSNNNKNRNKTGCVSITEESSGSDEYSTPSDHFSFSGEEEEEDHVSDAATGVNVMPSIERTVGVNQYFAFPSTPAAQSYNHERSPCNTPPPMPRKPKSQPASGGNSFAANTNKKTTNRSRAGIPPSPSPMSKPRPDATRSGTPMTTSNHTRESTASSPHTAAADMHNELKKKNLEMRRWTLALEQAMKKKEWDEKTAALEQEERESNRRGSQKSVRFDLTADEGEEEDADEMDSESSGFEMGEGVGVFVEEEEEL